MGQVYSWLMFGVVGFTPVERREEMLSVDSAEESGLLLTQGKA
jgi:hypothetical protein